MKKPKQKKPLKKDIVEIKPVTTYTSTMSFGAAMDIIVGKTKVENLKKSD